MQFFWGVCLLGILLGLLPFNADWSQVESKPMSARRSAIYDRRITQTKLYRLKQSIERSPFDIWFFKDRFQSEEDQLTFSLLWSSGIVKKSNTTSRLKNAILRSLNAESLDIAIMGGSISAGGGLSIDKEDMRGLYYRVFADWWQKTVQPFTGSSITIHNLSVGGTSSNFFSFCYKVLLNPNTNIDLAFFDFAVNDYVQLKDSKFPMALPLEQLIREVLSERNFPSILFINFVQGNLKHPVCNNLENHGQTQLAQNYGITSITLRNFFCSSPSNGKTFEKMFASDGNHPSMLAHAQVALMIINYVRNTILQVLDNIIISNATTVANVSLPSKTKRFELSDCSLSFRGLPKPLFAKKKVEFVDKPRCFTQITPDASKTSSLHQSLQVKALANFGFQFVQRVFINQPYNVDQAKIREFDPQKFRSDAYGGWKAQSSNSMLELEILIPYLTTISDIAKQCILKDGHTKINSTRNIAIAVRTHSKGATARVWLDEFEEKGALINTSSLFGHTKLHIIARHVTPGRHVISVRTETPGVFILSGVMTGPVYKSGSK